MTRPVSDSRVIVRVCLGKNQKKGQHLTLCSAGAKAEIHYIKGNSDAHFAVTGFTSKGACGCVHEEVLKMWPSLRPLVDLHLANTKGEPMYAGANGYFWAKEGNIDHLASTVGISVVEAEDLIVRYALTPFSQEWFEENIVAPKRMGWFKDAMTAVKLIRHMARNHKDRIDYGDYAYNLRRVCR